MQRPDVRRLRAARLWRRRGSVRRSHTRPPPCPPSLSHSRSRSCSCKCSCPCSHSCRPVNKRGALPRSPRNRGRDLSSRTASRLAARPPPWWSPCCSAGWVAACRLCRVLAKPAHTRPYCSGLLVVSVVSVECQQSLLMRGHCSGLSSLSSASKACSCTADAAACRLCRVPAKPAHALPMQ